MEQPSLHDATLLRVEVLWGETAEASFTFRAGGSRVVTLRVGGMTSLACPHANPWGPSVSVNEVRGPERVDGGSERLEIEMQSGDTIVVDGRAWEWSDRAVETF